MWEVGWWIERVVLGFGVTGKGPGYESLRGFRKAGWMGDEIFFDSSGENKREERGR